MFETRGFMLDISRGRVPTMRTLMLVVDILARYRYNHLQLCTGCAPDGESGFDFDGDSSMTQAEFAKLNAYCSMQGLELAANVDCRFDPARPGSAVLAKDRLSRMLSPCDSPFANIGCGAEDGVSDPGGQVRFLLEVAGAARSLGKRPMFWGDAASKRPDLVPSFPKDMVALVRGGEARHPFEKEAALFKSAGLDFCVCPDTSAARSLAGRVENMRENLQRAEKAGRENGAKGFILTDWGDEGHWQPLAVSLPAIILGGNFAASGPKAANMDVERELDGVMDAPLGGLLLRLGTLYLCGGAVRPGSSELFNILANPHGYSRHPGLTQCVLDEISGVASGVRIAAEKWCDRSDWAKEIVYMANMIDCACHRRDESRLRALRDEHGRIWRMRSREGGRVRSLSKLPRF